MLKVPRLCIFAALVGGSLATTVPIEEVVVQEDNGPASHKRDLEATDWKVTRLSVQSYRARCARRAHSLPAPFIAAQPLNTVHSDMDGFQAGCPPCPTGYEAEYGEGPNWGNVHCVEPGADKDPHLHFAHGGRADFRGKDRQCYNFFSAPGLSVNVRIEAATYMLSRAPGHALIVHGSFITEAHVAALVGPKRRDESRPFPASPPPPQAPCALLLQGPMVPRLRLGVGAQRRKLGVALRQRHLRRRRGQSPLQARTGRQTQLCRPLHRSALVERDLQVATLMEAFKTL